MGGELNITPGPVEADLDIRDCVTPEVNLEKKKNSCESEAGEAEAVEITGSDHNISKPHSINVLQPPMAGMLNEQVRNLDDLPGQMNLVSGAVGSEIDKRKSDGLDGLKISQTHRMNVPLSISLDCCE